VGARVGIRKIAADPHGICSARTCATFSAGKQPKESPTVGSRTQLVTEFYPEKMPNHRCTQISTRSRRGLDSVRDKELMGI
jgi:hypothetical protein